MQQNNELIFPQEGPRLIGYAQNERPKVAIKVKSFCYAKHVTKMYHDTFSRLLPNLKRTTKNVSRLLTSLKRTTKNVS